ncbi:MAG: hypothetical protein J6A29_00925 [Clostridia bacterium]|nr:hypothetical protein [Clostridia bacterium]
MGYILVIAIILGLLFGFSVAANVVSALLIAGLACGFIGCAVKAIEELTKLHIISAALQILGAVFFGWILSIMFL